jgi:hypothetical protein
MNIKLSASLLALTVATSLVSSNITPAFAQAVNQSDNGNNTATISSIATSVQAGTTNVQVVPPAVQLALNSVVAPATTAISSVTLAAISGGDAAALVAAPAAISNSTVAVAAATATARAAATLAAEAKTMVVNGAVNPAQVNKTIAAFNAYVTALVAQVGGPAALAIINAQGTGGLRPALVALSAAGVAAP